MKPVDQWPDRYRDSANGQHPSSPGDDFGRFLLPSPFHHDVMILVMVSSPRTGNPWEAVGICCWTKTARGVTGRKPTLDEIEFIRGQFFADSDLPAVYFPGPTLRDTLRPGWVHLWRHPDLVRTAPTPWPMAPEKPNKS